MTHHDKEAQEKTVKKVEETKTFTKPQNEDEEEVVEED